MGPRPWVEAWNVVIASMARDSYANEGVRGESSDDDDAGETSAGWAAPAGKIMIEIKPLSEMRDRERTNSASLEDFMFAPPPRARGSFGSMGEIGDALEALAAASSTEPAAARGGFNPKTQLSSANVGETTTATARAPPAGKPPVSGALSKGFDPYDMLDDIVGGRGAPEENDTRLDSVAIERTSASSPPSRPSLRDIGHEKVRRWQGPSSASVRVSGHISPRGGLSRQSFGADSAFYEELAQISLPDTDVIKPEKEFERGIKLFDANKLSEALFAFVAGAVNAVHSGNPIAKNCSAYATACKILRDTSTFLAANTSECARLTRHLITLPYIEDRHRRAALRFGSAKNFKAGNAGMAGGMIRRLMEISPPSSHGKLEAMLQQCVAAGETNNDIPADEDPMKMCAATLESIPKSSDGVRCVACGAMHSEKSSMETGQCVVCRSNFTG